MCGRYQFYDEKNQKLKELIEIAKLKMKTKDFEEISLFEVFPSQKAFVGVHDSRNDRFTTRVMKWGYTMKEKTIINARSETCFSSSFFKGSYPCVIPASSYYEWSRNPHIKYEFTTEEQPVYLGAICRREEDGFHFCILTEQATGMQKEIHDRQPLMFSYENAKKWCASQHPTSMFQYSIKNRLIEKA